jgi:cytochrome c oxidase subunit 5a
VLIQSPPSAFVVVAVVAAVASRSHPSAAMRAQVVSALIRARPSTVSRVTPRLVRLSSNGHHQETFEAFTDRYVNFFQAAEDLFEVQRGLNNCFAHDLVPAPAVVESALRASRRVNDYATAVRIFEGIKEKVENKTQYQAYLDELKPVREELGMVILSSRVSRFSFT